MAHSASPEIVPEFYPQLIADLRTILNEARDAMASTLSSITIECYWQLGRRIDDEHLTETALVKTIEQLENDLAIERSQLFRFVQFYRLWPDEVPVHTYQNLTWSHFKLLIPLKEDARAFYLTQGNEQKWPVRLLSQKIKDSEFSRSHSSGGAQLIRRSNALHVYKTELDYVVDGDTLVVNIDLGFDVWVKKRLRLRGIDTPEQRSDDPAEVKKAQEAKAFVEKRLKEGTTIIMQTFMVDLHGRFVADVFYLPGETNKEKIFAGGYFLNQQLLDEGLAVMM